MRIGIIAEGHADRAVIENILTGLTGLDSSSFVPLRPSDLTDETDNWKNAPGSFGSWTHVKNECQARELIDPFLLLDDHDFIVLHIDSAEAHLYGVTKPNPKTENYCTSLHKLILQKIHEWLGEDMSEVMLHAIAIEEIEAWLLTLSEVGDSSRYLDAKKRFERLMSKKNIDSTSDYSNFNKLSREFSKARAHVDNTFNDRNYSLAAFCTEVVDKVMPKLNEEKSEEAEPEI